MSTEPNTLAGWLSLLESRHDRQIQLGLERVAAVAARLPGAGNTCVISVAGTNGKGSTCAMLEAILLAAGYRVGTYTSPHLLRYNERVRVNGGEVSDEDLVAAFSRVEALRQDTPLSYFEHGTLAAWDVFSRSELDVVVLEVGLGGRLDAVNAFDADCVVLSSIALDHMDYLGPDRESIGREKAGIFRAGRPAVCADPEPPESVLERARELGADLLVCGQDYGYRPLEGGVQWAWWRKQGPRRGGLAYPALRGHKQLRNAATVMMALDALKDRLPVSMQAIREGLMLVDLPGRFQALAGRPTVVLDVAHNPEAATTLVGNLLGMAYHPETWAVFGMLGDKDVEGVVKALAPRVDHWLLASLAGPRGLSAVELERRLRAAGVEGDVAGFDAPAAAFAAAQERAGEDDRILVSGSFLTVAAVLAERQAARS